MRLVFRTLMFVTVATISAAACSSDPTGVTPSQDAVDAATRFQELAEEAYAAGADPEIVRAYVGLGIEIQRGGRVSPVTIVVDGVAQEFLATARQIDLDAGATCAQPGSLCLLAPPLRSVVAWQKSDPRRVVQLSAMGGAGEIGTPIPGLVDPGTFGRASLIYLDGAGGAFVGTSGTGSIGDPVTSDIPCRTTTTPPPPSPSSLSELPVRCTRAEFTASFSGALAPAPVPLRGNTATGTHTIAMSPQSILGARLMLPGIGELSPCGDCVGGYPRAMLPPIAFSGEALAASLGVNVGADGVTFTLRITNGRAQPVTLRFISGQQYDFRVRRADGSIAWTWSMDKLFTAALTERTLASGETVVYTGTWEQPTKGTFLAEGRLTSTSHSAAAGRIFVVP
jgi:hypothetical protein